MITLIKDKIYVFRDKYVAAVNPTNQYAIGRYTGEISGSFYILELIKPKDFPFKWHNNEAIMGWSPSVYKFSAPYKQLLIREAEFSHLFWEISLEAVITEVDHTQHDINKLAEVINGGDLDGITYYIETIKNSEYEV